MSGPAAPNGRAPISLVVSDVDGTLLTTDKRLTEASVAAAARLRAAGIAFGIISARPPRALAPLIDKLGLNGVSGAFNGGALVGPDLAVLEMTAVPPAPARQAAAIMAEHGADLWVFTADEWLVRDADGAYVAHEAATAGFPPRVVPDLAPFLDRAGKLVGVSADYAMLERCEAAVQAALGESASAIRSQHYYLDITAPAARKGEGVRAIAGRLGVPMEEVAVLGDMQNDVSMFAVAGFAIAMGNAPPDVQAAAHVVTLANDADGFAAAVDRLILPRREQRA